MRKRILVVLILSISGLCTATASPTVLHNTIEVKNNQVVVRKRNPGHTRIFARVSGCHTWIEWEETEWYDGDGNLSIFRSPYKARSCPGLYGGTAFRVRDDWPAGDLTAVASPPSFDLKIQPHWYTQRVGYFWLSKSLRNVEVNLVAQENKELVLGRAVLTPERILFDPGVGREGELDSVDCDTQRLFDEYDKSKPHYDPNNLQSACSYIYMSSTKSGLYHPKLKIFWKVLSAALNDPPGLAYYNVQGLPNVESSSNPIDLRVEEIQTILTCVSTAKTSCG